MTAIIILIQVIYCAGALVIFDNATETNNPINGLVCLFIAAATLVTAMYLPEMITHALKGFEL